ncbi:hypothetical protein F8388_007031 [Cannabis sativa]|uniref:Uncharacterized protein n=1 Tax=Cannabis sativa TaxID=3483 RepID=A0A7J6GPW5_CANSA|nr:hypothetical protein F8388_007031 [Cannabis sativa]KAF4384881.1 hypothetical protein G4B88_000277 [Cannabis sativa]
MPMEGELGRLAPCSSLAVDSVLRVGTVNIYIFNISFEVPMLVQYGACVLLLMTLVSKA